MHRKPLYERLFQRSIPNFPRQPGGLARLSIKINHYLTFRHISFIRAKILMSTFAKSKGGNCLCPVSDFRQGLPDTNELVNYWTMRRLYKQLLIDIGIACAVFFFSLWLHADLNPEDIRFYGGFALIFYGSHLFISLAYRKYETDTTYSNTELVKLYTRSWLTTSGLALLFLYTLQVISLSRMVILTNIFGLIGVETLYILSLALVRKAIVLHEKAEHDALAASGPEALLPPILSHEDYVERMMAFDDEVLDEVGEEALLYISQYMDTESGKTLILHTTNRFNILSQPGGAFQKIVNLHRLNDVRYVNKLLEAINSRLPEQGLMAVCAETKNQRKDRILAKYPPLLNYGYYAFDFLVKRVLPKVPVGKKFYFFLTRGQNRVMSRAEILGRICSCGFRIVEEQKINGKLYVIARKVGQPAFNEHATYGSFIYLNRVGKDGKMIRVYKFRTMHPFSEYLQDYIYENNNLGNGGKIMDDYRVTTPGRLMRRFWLDELPMLINYFRGEMKLVGVRPLSNHYFSLYSPEMQQMRIQVKPGLIPPFYADMPSTFEEIEASERRYLEAYQQSRLRTDVRYFCRIFYNIVFKRARSK